jgi:hypothetical protein
MNNHNHPQNSEVTYAHAVSTTNMAQVQQCQQQAPPLPHRDKLREFQKSKPPTFFHSIEPIDMDDWLKYIEKKL